MSCRLDAIEALAAPAFDLLHRLAALTRLHGGAIVRAVEGADTSGRCDVVDLSGRRESL